MLVAGLAASVGAAQAAEAQRPLFSARIGPSLGFYYADATTSQTRIDDDFESPSFFNDTGDFFEGLQLGLSASHGRFVADLGLDYMRFKAPGFNLGTIDRYDALLTVGVIATSHLSVFSGYRIAWQGDGFFDDDIWKESGAVVGASYGGIEMGPLLLGVSAAYSFSEAEYPDGSDFDYPGISLKLNLSVADAPNHALQLRYQRFSGDYVYEFPGEEAGTFGTIRAVERLSERFAMLTYVYYWSF